MSRSIYGRENGHNYRKTECVACKGPVTFRKSLKTLGGRTCRAHMTKADMESARALSATRPSAARRRNKNYRCSKYDN